MTTDRKSYRRLLLAVLAMLCTVLVVHARGNIKQVEQGNAAFEQRHFTDAIECYYDVMQAYKNGERDTSMCSAFRNAGVACFLSNRYVEALKFYTTSVELSQQYHDWENYEFCTSNIGIIYAVFRDYERAVHYFEQSYQSASKHDNAYNRSIAILDLVAGYCKLGDVDNALRCYRLQNLYPIDSGAMRDFYINYNQGLIAHASQDYSAARYYQELAKKVAVANGMKPVFLADADLEIGRAHEAQGNYQQALQEYAHTIQTSRDNGYMDQMAEAYERTAEVYKQLGQEDSARVYQSLWLGMRDSVFNDQQFNKAKDELTRYENRINAEHISSLKWIILVISAVAALLLALLAVIYFYNRKLHSAHQMLVNKNEELMRSDESNKALLQKYIQALQAVEQERATAAPDDDVKAHATEMLDEEQISRLLVKINEVMSDVGQISSPDFGLPALARLTESNTTYVSRAINDGYGKNFKTLLNEYRIREACKRLTDEENYGNLTIVAIGESLGYKSSTSFIQAFKKIIGVTPAVYKKLSQ